MQHWSPDKAREADAPADAWTLWLSRPPEHPAPPPPLPRPSAAGVAVIAGIASFWIGAIALGWHLLS